MRNGSPYLGGGRYIQAEGAAELLGGELRKFGVKKAYIIGGRTALSVAMPKIAAGLAEERVEYEAGEHHGHCTEERCAAHREKAERSGAEIIVGIGGGKALDTAKYVAYRMGKDVITIPTSAATCAAFAVLSVMYTESGDVLGSVFFDREVRGVLVDLEILMNRCPVRMFASGIGDAAAKYPEISFSMKYSQDWEKSVLPSAALMMSKFTWDTLGKIGAKALSDGREKRITREYEDAVCASIPLTGTVSSLASGGKQLAVAHTFYYGVCKHFKDTQRAFLHGEIVSAGIPLQLLVNGAHALTISEARAFLSSLGTPMTFKDLGIEPTSRNAETLHEYIRTAMGLTEEWMKTRLREGLAQLL